MERTVHSIGEDRDERSRRLLQEARQALDGAREAMEQGAASCGQVASGAVDAVRLSLQALLAWNGVPFDQEASVGGLARPAENLTSALRTPMQLWAGLAPIVRRIAGTESVSRADCETARTAWFTARNTVVVVESSLPEVLKGPGGHPEVAGV